MGSSIAGTQPGNQPGTERWYGKEGKRISAQTREEKRRAESGGDGLDWAELANTNTIPQDRNPISNTWAMRLAGQKDAAKPAGGFLGRLGRELKNGIPDFEVVY